MAYNWGVVVGLHYVVMKLAIEGDVDLSSEKY